MADAERTCVVCRRSVGRDEALRFVLGPDGAAAVDWRRKLPGRGANACWTRACLEQVGQRGRLERSFRTAVRLPGGDWPLGDARRWVARRQGELAGLAMRSGELKAGGNLVDRLVKRDWPAALVISTDVGKTVADDLGRKAWGKEIPLLTSILTSDELGVALGKPGPRSVLAVGYGPLAEALTLELKRGLALS
jgi:uncharacterized protein